MVLRVLTFAKYASRSDVNVYDNNRRRRNYYYVRSFYYLFICILFFSFDTSINFTITIIVSNCRNAFNGPGDFFVSDARLARITTSVSPARPETDLRAPSAGRRAYRDDDGPCVTPHRSHIVVVAPRLVYIIKMIFFSLSLSVLRLRVPRRRRRRIIIIL